MASSAFMEPTSSIRALPCPVARRGDLKHDPRMSSVARFTESQEEGRRILRFQGDLTLLRQVEQADQPVKVRPDPPSPFARVLDQIGSATLEAGRTVLGLIGFLGGMLLSLAYVIRQP